MEHQRLSGMDRGRRILPEAGRLNRLSQMTVFLMRLLLKIARRSVGMAWWLLTGVAFFGTLHAAERFVDLGENGKLVYEFDDQGNRMPDFSHAGYAGGGVAIPSVPAKVLVAPLEGDNTRHIQSAIDHVSSLPMDEHGFRGAVCLTEGWFEIHGQLRIESSGVVLRGSGDGEDGTVLNAVGHSRRTLLEFNGRHTAFIGMPRSILDEYVPVNASSFILNTVDGLSVGQSIQVRRPSPQNWIDLMGMSSVKGRPTPAWKPDTVDILWERTISGIDGNSITLDVPLTCALEKQFGGGEVIPVEARGRLRQSGVENMRFQSAWDQSNPKDEEHAWMAITLDHVEDAWVRQVTALHFVSSLVSVWETCRRISVMDCRSLKPVSEIGGYRRHAFHTAGQQTLFLRCYSEKGRHDFSTGWRAAGPNVFVHCEANNALDFSGPIESWATGVLYDNLIMDGGGLRFDNREMWDNGVGWAAGNCVAWQCSLPLMTNRKPPAAANWAIGIWAQFLGDGHWRSSNEFVDPDSLYIGQLKDRLGSESLRALESVDFVVLNAHLSDVPLWESDHTPEPDKTKPSRKLALQNGWLTVDGLLAKGRQPGIAWWRGHASSSRVEEFGINLTRFVPGRDGKGLTDDLEMLVERMSSEGAVGLRHHPGLWYDRRRDDHEMIRRIDGNVWPPFFELPWARSGQGAAWDGLSKYDLTRYNPWYFDRLKSFADLCQQQGLVFLNAMYFQHHILEAGAHWADYPWRSINNINATAFPEPPPYANRKRIFMAEDFYDVDHPVRRKLHQRFIQQCLSNLKASPNVIHLLGEEYSGPLHFMAFWLDTVGDWMREHHLDHLIGLSAPKGVQDALLNDPDRSGLVDVIDFKYWWISPKGLYAPKGGENLAPRQHERLWKGGRPKDEHLARMAAEYRSRYPGKAVISHFDQAKWAFLCAGGSMPNLPATASRELLEGIPDMRPWLADAEKNVWALWGAGSGGLVYVGEGNSFILDLTGKSGDFVIREVMLESGKVSKEVIAKAKGTGKILIPSGERPAVYRVEAVVAQ